MQLQLQHYDNLIHKLKTQDIEQLKSMSEHLTLAYKEMQFKQQALLLQSQLSSTERDLLLAYGKYLSAARNLNDLTQQIIETIPLTNKYIDLLREMDEKIHTIKQSRPILDYQR